MNSREISREIAYAAITGALYATLTMALPLISYGPIQFRVAEALCVLPFFMPGTALGLFVGCAIANLLSAAGVVDVVFGSLATLAAALLTAKIGKSYKDGRESEMSLTRCIKACAMPVILNGPIIGAVLAYTYTPDAFWQGFVFFMGEVALGEAAVMMTFGLGFMRLIQRLGIIKKFS